MWAAIQRTGTPDGVLVLMDLGSAVLSAELAIELAGDDAPPIVLSEAPIVEGLVAAVVAAAGGATLAEVATEAANTAEIKAKLLGVGVPVSTDGELARISPPPAASVEVALHNAHGLHARPAARLVETVRRFDAEVAVRNVTVGGPLVNARSISAVSTIGAVAGHHIEIQASGRQAREALAAVVALVRRNFDDNAAAAHPADQPSTSGPMAAAPGIGVGPKCTLAPARPVVTTDRVAGRPEDERARLVAAVQRAGHELHATRQRVALATTDHEAAIFDAHLLLLDDADELVSTAIRFIDARPGHRRGGVAASRRRHRRPVRLAHRPVSTSPRRRRRRRGPAGGSAVERGRGRIVRRRRGCRRRTRPQPDGGSRTRSLTGDRRRHRLRQPRLPRGDPRPLARDPDGGRAPEPTALAVADGTTVVVDGTAGVVLFDPAPQTVRDYLERGRHRAPSRRGAAAGRDPPCRHHRRRSRRGRRQHRLGRRRRRRDPPRRRQRRDCCAPNSSSSTGTNPPARPNRLPATCPSPTPSAAAGSRSGRWTSAATSTSRTSPAHAEANPFLGRRGIRLSLEQPELFKQQLRAIVRVGLEHPVSVIFPMVSTIDELRAAKQLLEDAATEVGCRRGELPLGFEVGVMVEVPALALHAPAAAALVDLFSIGTNDLTQYTLAAERGNAAVARLADPLDPAVLRLIAAITDAAGETTRVAVCGEIAADPDAAAVLIGLGVDELSMAPPAIPATKQAVRSRVPRRGARPRSPGARARIGGRRPSAHRPLAKRARRRC